MEKKLIINLVAFILVIAIGVASYLVIRANLYPRNPLAKNSQAEALIRGKITPTLSVAAIDLMRSRRTIPQAELQAGFSVYLENTDIAIASNDPNLYLKYLSPLRPYDVDYEFLVTLTE